MQKLTTNRAEITIETHSVTRITTRGMNRMLVHCDACLRGVTPLAVEQVAAAMKLSPLEVADLCINGTLHRVQSTDICSNSLALYYGREVRLLGSK